VVAYKTTVSLNHLPVVEALSAVLEAPKETGFGSIQLLTVIEMDGAVDYRYCFR